jgi:hypothetical protein
MMKIGFHPIGLQAYVKLHLKANPDMHRQEVVESLQAALAAHRRGVHCTCGNRLWVIGSAFIGYNACFTCITGKAMPDEDYELEEAF